jgi:uncharacterized protein HemY
MISGLSTLRKNIVYTSKKLIKKGPDKFLYQLHHSPLYENTEEAESLIKEGLKKYPFNPDLNKYLAQMHYDQKKWTSAIQHWTGYFDYTGYDTPLEELLQLTTAYEKTKNYSCLYFFSIIIV